MTCILLIVLAPAASAGLTGTHSGYRLAVGSSVTRVVLQFDPLNALVPPSWRSAADNEPPSIIPAQSFRMSFAGPGAGTRFLATDCLTAAVYYEAANEPLVGQRAVAQVVLNRLKHPAYPNTVCGVVFQGSERTTGCQFTFTCDGSLRRNPSIGGWLRARAVAAAALSGYVEPSIGHATHYHAVYVNPYWAANLDKIDTIASHTFYQWPGKAGTPAAFSQPYGIAETMPASAASALSSYMLAAPFAMIAAQTSGSVGVDLLNPLSAELPASGLASRGPVTTDADATQAVRSAAALGTSRLAVPETRLKDNLSRSALIADQPALLD